MHKYYNIFIFNLKTELNFKIDYIASLFSFVVHILVFNYLWEFILGSKIAFEYSKNKLIWYVVVCELIAYTTSKSYRKISLMIKNGDVGAMLVKPINFLMYILSQECTSLVKLLFNGIFAIFFGILIAGRITITLSNATCFAISLVFSIFLQISIQIFIGTLAFITEENRAFYNIISKAMYLLLFTPIEFFSSKVQTLLKFLPTTYIMYPSAKILVNFNFEKDIYLILGQVVSIICVWIVTILIYKKGVKDINVNGG